MSYDNYDFAIDFWRPFERKYSVDVDKWYSLLPKTNNTCNIFSYIEWWNDRKILKGCAGLVVPTEYILPLYLHCLSMEKKFSKKNFSGRNKPVYMLFRFIKKYTYLHVMVGINRRIAIRDIID